MSTGLDCQFFEYRPNQWYYALQRGLNDWEPYDTFGPFSTQDAAFEHLHDNNANPGGHSQHPYESDEEMDRWYGKWVAEAEKPSFRRSNPFLVRW